MGQFSFKCTDEELAGWKQMAKGEGKTLSELIRGRLGSAETDEFEEGERPKKVREPLVTPVIAAMAEKVAEIVKERPRAREGKFELCEKYCKRKGVPSCPDCRAGYAKAGRSAVEVFGHME